MGLIAAGRLEAYFPLGVVLFKLRIESNTHFFYSSGTGNPTTLCCSPIGSHKLNSNGLGQYLDGKSLKDACGPQEIISIVQ